MKTDKQRSADLAQRKKDRGEAKASISVWVLERDKEACKAAMKKAAKPFVKAAFKSQTGHTG